MVRPPLLERKTGPGASEGVNLKPYVYLIFFFDSLHIFMLFLV